MEPLPLRLRAVSGVISTDDIIPGRYKHMFTDTRELAKHVFENLLPGFAAQLAPGDAILSRDTFGIGSSREQAVSSLMTAGVRAVLAPRFGRIFFRNAWNLGLIAVAIPPSAPLRDLDRVTLHPKEGRIEGAGGTVRFSPPPAMMLEMIEKGGLLSLVQQRLQSRRGVAAGAGA
jgi:3-isopropylmalate/(R)-2-methylmalate dehydratase small subunit